MVFAEINQIKLCRSQEYDSLDQECTSCEDKNCKKCINTKCLQCIYGYDYQMNQCLSKDQQCLDGYYFDSQSEQCTKCQIPGCLQCQNNNECSIDQCQAGFQLDDSNKQCTLKLFVDEQTQDEYDLYKTLLRDNEYELKYNCPILYNEMPQIKMCNKIQFCSDEVKDEDFQFNDPIIQIEIYQIKNLIIIVSQKQIALFDSQSIELIYLLIDFNQSQVEEYIHNIILSANIINIFTDKRIIPFDLQKLQFLKSISFKQRQYDFPIKGRFYFNLEEKEIAYIFMDDIYLYFAIIQMNFEFDQSNNISSNTYLLSLKYKIILMQDLNYVYSITYIPHQDILLITNQQQFIVLFINKKDISQNSPLRLSEDNIQSKNTQLEYSEKYDQIEYDDQNNIYLFRKGINSYFLVSIQIEIMKEKKPPNKKVDFKFDPKDYPVQKNYLASLQKQGQIIFLQLSSEMNGDNMIEKQSIVIQYLPSGSEDSYELQQDSIVNDNIISIYIKTNNENKENSQSIIMISSVKSLFFLEFNEAERMFVQKLIQPLNPQFILDFSLSQLSIRLQNNNENPIVEIYVPCYKNFFKYKLLNNEIKINQYLQQVFKDQNDYFSLSLQEKIIVADQVIAYDNLHGQLYLFEWIQKRNSIQIQHINIETNQQETFKIHYMIVDCTQTTTKECMKNAYVDSYNDNLILIFYSQIFLFHKYSLQKIQEISCKEVLDYQYPFFFVNYEIKNGFLKKFIQVTQNGEFKVLKQLKFGGDDPYYRFFKASPKTKRCQVLYISDELKSTQYVFCDGKEIQQSEYKQIMGIQQVEFVSDDEFIVIYVREDYLYSLLRQKIIIQENKIEEKEQLFELSLGFLDRAEYFEPLQNIIVNEQIQLYFRCIKKVEWQTSINGIIEVLDLSSFTIISRLKTLKISLQNQYNTPEQIFFDVDTLTLQIHYKKLLINGSNDIKTKIQKFTYSILTQTFSEYWLSYNNAENHGSMQQNSLIYDNQKQQFSYTDIDASNHFIGILFSFKQDKDQGKINFLYEKNLVYFYDGKRSQISQNIPLLKNQKYYQFQTRKKNNNWWISDTLGILILISYVPEQINPPIPIQESQKVSFILLDTLELLFEDINISSQGFVYWNEKYITLVKCENNKISKYSIKNNSIYLEYTYEINLNGFQFDSSKCIFTEINPFVICSGFGIFDFENQKPKFMDIQDIKIQSFYSQKPSFIENDLYIIFSSGNDQLFFYSIQNQKLSPFNSKIIKDINKLQMAFKSGSQLLYMDPSQGCYIFLLPTFEILQNVSIDLNQSNQSIQVCQFALQTQTLIHYLDGTMYLYRISQKQRELELIVKKKLIQTIQLYFREDQNDYTDSENSKINPIQSKDRYFIGQILQKFYNRYDTYRTYLIIDSITGDIQTIKGQLSRQNFSIILNIWIEKKLMITDDQLITISDNSISIKLNGQDDNFNQQQYKYSKNYNYIIYEAEDYQELQILDISEFLPSFTKNSYSNTLYNMESTNSFLQNFLKDSNNNTRELIYFDLKKYILYKAIYNIQINNQVQGTKQYIQKKTIRDISNILNISLGDQIINTKSLYQVFLLHQDDMHLKKIYALNYGCKLFVIQENGNIIHQLNLNKYRCKIKKASNSYNDYQSDSHSFNNQQNQSFLQGNEPNTNKESILYLINDNLKIEQLIYENEKFALRTQHSESITSSLIKSYLYLKNDKNSDIIYSCITFSSPHNKIIINQQQNDKIISKEILIDNVYKITNYIFLNFYQLNYLLIGADNKVITFYIEEISQTDFKVNQTYMLDLEKRGSIQNIFIYTQLNPQQNILILTTKSRVLKLISSGSQNSLTFQLKRESLIHSRNYHQLKIFQKNQILVVFSKLQISLYSLSSLQFIARIEELFILQIRDVQMVENYAVDDEQLRNEIFVCDSDKILIYNIKKFKEQQRLQMQIQFIYNLPIIYFLIDSKKIQNMNEDSIIINGYHFTGPFSIKYIPNQNITSQQDQSVNDNEQSCINTINFPQKFYEQQRLYEDLLNSQLSNSKNYSIYFQFQQKQDLLIPMNLVNYENNQNNFDIQIDLNYQKGNLKTILASGDKEGLVHNLKISNGFILLNENVSLFNIETLIFSNIVFILSQEFLSQNMVELKTIKSVNFENIRFEESQKTIEQITTDQQQIIQPSLFSFNNCTDITIINFEIKNMIIKRDILGFNKNNMTIIKQMNFFNLELHGRLVSFMTENQKIKITQVQIKNSQILQGFSIIQTKELFMNKIQISNVKNIQNMKQFQRNLEDQINDGMNIAAENLRPEEYGTFIFVRLVYKKAEINQVNINQESQFQKFLDYSCIYVSQNTEKKSKEAILNMSNFSILNSTFKQSLINAQESKITLSQVKSLKSKNSSINIVDSLNGINLTKVSYDKNTFENTSIIQIKDSLIQLYDISFTQNTIQIQQLENIEETLQIYALQILNSNFFLNKVFAYNNTSPDFLMLIEKQLYEQSNLFSNFIIDQQQSILDFNVQQSSRGALKIKDLTQIRIQQSIFSNNSILKQTKEGGAIMIKNTTQCQLIQSKIQNNQAILSGGGIYLDESDIFIIQSQISGNSALIGGGIRYKYFSKQPIYFFQSCYKQCIYHNSAIIFGQNYGSEPIIKIISSLDDWPSSVNQIMISLIFEVYGEDGELVNFEQPKIEDKDNITTIAIKNEQINQISIYTSFSLFALDNSAVIETKSKENTRNSFNITSFITSSGYKNLTKYSEQPNEDNVRNIIGRKALQIRTSWKDVNFTVSFRPCAKGEIIRSREQDSYECRLCEKNTYSIQNPYINIGQQNCSLCPIESTYCKGSLIIPQDGYWVDPGTDYIAYCENMPSKCVPLKYQSDLNNSEYSKLTNGCNEGGYGPLCESCDYENNFWGKQQDAFYAKKNSYECYKCEDQDEKIEQYILTISLIIIVYAFVIFQLFKNILTNLINLKALLLKKLKLIYISSSLMNKTQQSTVLKIIISYFQIVSVVSQFRLNMPDLIQKLLFFVGNILGLTFYILDCLFVQTGLALNVKMIYLRLMWTLVSPIVSLIFLALMSRLIIKKYQLMKYKSNILVSGFTQFYYLIYPGLIQQTIGTICCKNYNNQYYILLDSQYKCFDKEYFYYNMLISLPLLIITTIIPLIIYIKMTKNKQNLTRVNVYLNYGFFFQEYKSQNYSWEIIRIYKKIFLYCVIGIFNQSSIVAGFLVSLSIIYYIKYQQLKMPFNILFFNRLDHLSQITAVITIFGFIIYSQSDSIGLLQYTFLGLVIIINTIFFFQTLIYLILITSSSKIKKQNLKNLQNLLKFVSIQIPTVSSNQKINILRGTKNWKKIQGFIKISRFLRVIKDSEQKEYIQNSIDKQLLMSQSKSIKDNYESQIQKQSIYMNDEIDEKVTFKSIQMTRNVLIGLDDASSDVQEDLHEFKKNNKKKSQSVGYQFKQ